MNLSLRIGVIFQICWKVLTFQFKLFVCILTHYLPFIPHDFCHYFLPSRKKGRMDIKQYNTKLCKWGRASLVSLFFFISIKLVSLWSRTDRLMIPLLLCTKSKYELLYWNIEVVCYCRPRDPIQKNVEFLLKQRQEPWPKILWVNAN